VGNESDSDCLPYAIGEKIKHSNSFEKGIKWINFSSDVQSAIETRFSLAEWSCSLRNIREPSYFASDDPMSWIISSSDKLIFANLRKIIRL